MVVRVMILSSLPSLNPTQTKYVPVSPFKSHQRNCLCPSAHLKTDYISSIVVSMPLLYPLHYCIHSVSVLIPLFIIIVIIALLYPLLLYPFRYCSHNVAVSVPLMCPFPQWPSCLAPAQPSPARPLRKHDQRSSRVEHMMGICEGGSVP